MDTGRNNVHLCCGLSVLVLGINLVTKVVALRGVLHPRGAEQSGKSLGHLKARPQKGIVRYVH